MVSEGWERSCVWSRPTGQRGGVLKAGEVKCDRQGDREDEVNRGRNKWWLICKAIAWRNGSVWAPAPRGCTYLNHLSFETGGKTGINMEEPNLRKRLSWSVPPWVGFHLKLEECPFLTHKFESSHCYHHHHQHYHFMSPLVYYKSIPSPTKKHKLREVFYWLNNHRRHFLTWAVPYLNTVPPNYC